MPEPFAERVQASWTGDKESMIQKHEGYAHEAAKQGAQFILFQELFYGPYFCQVQDAQYYSYTEHIPDGPTTKRMQDLARQTGMVVVAPMYEEDDKASGIINTAADRRDGITWAARAASSAAEFGSHFRPGNLGYPFEIMSGRRRYICTTTLRARRTGLTGLIVLIPSDLARSVRVPADRTGHGRQRLLRRDDQRVDRADGDDDFTARLFRRPARPVVGELGSAHDEELMVRDLDLDKIAEVRNTWQFYRDRRPDAYADLTRP
jgi:N-carbamoylputrescine amidase